MKQKKRVHVIGAGLAGLAAAVRLAKTGVRVELSEAAAQAGGRCRSYFDPQLGAVIDNGNHLVMSGNHAVFDYLAAIGSRDHLIGPAEAAFDFVDLQTLKRWTVRPNPGPVPWWIFSDQRRAPGTRARDYLPLAGLVAPRAGARVDQTIPCEGEVWRGLMQPFLLAALNTRPEEGSAALAAAVVRETLVRGGRAYRPRIAEPTLASAFVDPALDYIAKSGGLIRTGRRLRSLELSAERAASLIFSDSDTEECGSDAVVLAVPPWSAESLVPGLSVPDEFRSIVNGHFKYESPKGLSPLVGVVGGTVEWIFAFPDRIGVTVSSADAIVEEDRETLAARLWAEVARVHDLPTALPPWQIVKEKRATFAATVAQDAKRPPPETRWRNLTLAGDWIQTGLPGTIEGAVRSGFRAADLATRALNL